MDEHVAEPRVVGVQRDGAGQAVGVVVGVRDHHHQGPPARHPSIMADRKVPCPNATEPALSGEPSCAHGDVRSSVSATLNTQ